MKRKVLLALALLASSVTSASAEVKKHPTAKVEIDVPTGWKMQSPKGEPNAMMMTDSTEDVFAIFVAVDPKDNGTEVEKYLSKIATNVKWEMKQPEMISVNGMEAKHNKGTGKVAGKDADLGLLLIKSPGPKMVLILIAIDSTKHAVHKDEVNKLVASIKPST